jgi:hypothetical protein
MNTSAQWIGLLTALGVGLLIGVVRERRQVHTAAASIAQPILSG